MACGIGNEYTTATGQRCSAFTKPGRQQSRPQQHSTPIKSARAERQFSVSVRTLICNIFCAFVLQKILLDTFVVTTCNTMVTQTPPSEDPTTTTTSTITSVVPKDNVAEPKVKGLKLFILLASTTLVTFLALLDTSILGTVCLPPHCLPLEVLTMS